MKNKSFCVYGYLFLNSFNNAIVQRGDLNYKPIYKRAA